MAKVIRSCWVYRPHGRWHRYLPRRKDGIKPMDYSVEGGIDDFRQRELRDDEPLAPPSKLWLVWLYRDLTGQPKYTRQKVEKLFGADFEVGRREVFMNTEEFNKELWQVKHLIELRPITFPNGEPTDEQAHAVELAPDGRCLIKDRDLSGEQDLKFFDDKKQWTTKQLISQKTSQYDSFKEIFEANVYTPANITVVK